MKDIGFQDKLSSTVALVESVKTLAVSNDQEFAMAKYKLDSIRILEKELDEEYKSHPIIVEAKRLQAIKGDIATMLEQARKNLKNGVMLKYERAEEDKRIAEEQRLAVEARKRAEDEAVAIAIKHEESGYNKEAESILTAAIDAPVTTVVIPKTAPTVSRRMIKKFKIVNEAQIKPIYLMADAVKIGGVVRSLGKTAEQVVGGIFVWEEPA